MPRAAKAATTDIRIAPYRSVVIDGRARGAGEVVSVPTNEAETLLAEGYAESASTPAKREDRKRAAKPASAPRRPLTPQAIDDGDEERGG